MGLTFGLLTAPSIGLSDLFGPFAVIAGVLAGLSTVFYLIGVGTDPASTVVTASLFPAISVLVGRSIYDDDVSARQVLGLAVVVVGVIGVGVG